MIIVIFVVFVVLFSLFFDFAGCEYLLLLCAGFVAEWWVHSRPHCSGHQLHYDSDETSIENGGKKPRHPLATMVIFLSDKEDSREGQEQEDLCPSAYVGGPTLMTDQVLNGPLAKKGWLAFPKINRICLFDSNYLHGTQNYSIQ